MPFGKSWKGLMDRDMVALLLGLLGWAWLVGGSFCEMFWFAIVGSGSESLHCKAWLSITFEDVTCLISPENKTRDGIQTFVVLVHRP